MALIGGIKIISEEFSKLKNINNSKGAGTLGCFVRGTVSPNDVSILTAFHNVMDPPFANDKTGLCSNFAGECFQLPNPAHKEIRFRKAINPCCFTCSGIGVTTMGMNHPNIVPLYWIDAALVRLDDQKDFIPRIFIPSGNRHDGRPQDPTIMGLITGSGTAAEGDEVYKVGGFTGLTVGTIKKVIPIMHEGEQLIAGYEILCKSPDYNYFAQSGDSGSAIVHKESGRVIGIFHHNDGDRIGNESKATGIKLIEKLFKVEVIPSGSAFLSSESVNDELVQEYLSDKEGHLNFDLIPPFLAVFQDEVIDLVNNNRKVAVVWQRHKGPQFMNHLINNFKNPDLPLIKEIEQISITDLFREMAFVLKISGSEKLKDQIEHAELIIISSIESCISASHFLTLLHQNFTPNE